MGLPIDKIEMGDVHYNDGKCACCMEKKVVDGNLITNQQGLGNCHCGCCPCVPDNLKFSMIDCKVENPFAPSPAYENWDNQCEDCNKKQVDPCDATTLPGRYDVPRYLTKMEDCPCSIEFDLNSDEGVQCNKAYQYSVYGAAMASCQQTDCVQYLDGGGPFRGPILFNGEQTSVPNKISVVQDSPAGGDGFACGGGEYVNAAFSTPWPYGSLGENHYYSDAGLAGPWQQSNEFKGAKGYSEAWGYEGTICNGCQDSNTRNLKTVNTQDPKIYGDPKTPGVPADLPLVWDKSPGSCAGMNIRASLCCCKTGIPQSAISFQNQWQPDFTDDLPDNEKGKHPCLISDNTQRNCSNCIQRQSAPQTTWKELFMITADVDEDGNPTTKQKDYYEGGIKTRLTITWSLVERGTRLGNVGCASSVVYASTSSEEDNHIGQELNKLQILKPKGQDSQNPDDWPMMPDAEVNADTQRVTQEEFIADIKAAFDIWEKTFNWMYPWLHLKFIMLAPEGFALDREGNMIELPAGTEPPPKIPLDAATYSLDNRIGDIRIAMGSFDCDDVAGVAFYPDSWERGMSLVPEPPGGMEEFEILKSLRDEACRKADEYELECQAHQGLWDEYTNLDTLWEAANEVEENAQAALDQATAAKAANQALLDAAQQNLTDSQLALADCLQQLIIDPSDTDCTHIDNLITMYTAHIEKYTRIGLSLQHDVDDAQAVFDDAEAERLRLGDLITDMLDDPAKLEIIRTCEDAIEQREKCNEYTAEIAAIEADKENWNHVWKYTGSRLGHYGTSAGDIVLSNFKTEGDFGTPSFRSTKWRWRKDGTSNKASSRDCAEKYTTKLPPEEGFDDSAEEFFEFTEGTNGNCPDGYTNAQGKGHQCNINIKRTMLYLIGIAMGIPRNKDPNFPELSRYGGEDCRAVMYRPTFVEAGNNEGQNLKEGCAGQDGEKTEPKAVKGFGMGRGGEWCKDVAEQWPGIEGDHGFASIKNDQNWRLWPDLWYIASQYGNAGRYATEDDLRPAGGGVRSDNGSVRNFVEWDRYRGPLTQDEVTEQYFVDGKWLYPPPPGQDGLTPADVNDRINAGGTIPTPLDTRRVGSDGEYVINSPQCNSSQMQFTIQPDPKNRHELLMASDVQIEQFNNMSEDLQGYLDEMTACNADPNCTDATRERIQEDIDRTSNNLANARITEVIWSPCSPCVLREKHRHGARVFQAAAIGPQLEDWHNAPTKYTAQIDRGGLFRPFYDGFTTPSFKNHIIKSYCKGANDGGSLNPSYHAEGNRADTEFMVLVEGTWIMSCDCHLGFVRGRDKWRCTELKDPNDPIPCPEDENCGPNDGDGQEGLRMGPDNNLRAPYPAIMRWSGVITEA